MNDDFEFEIVKNNRLKKGKSILKFCGDFTLIDTETTGLDPKCCELIEVAGLKVRNNEIVDTFSQLIKPSCEIDSFITEITGITNEMVENSPNVSDVLPQYLNFIGNDIVVGHNVNFDVNFIYDNNVQFFDMPFCNDFIDTMRLSRKILPILEHHRLKDLVKHYKICQKVEHRALSDCNNLFQCYLKLRDDFEAIADNSNLLKYVHKQIYAKDLMPKTTEFDESSQVFGMSFVFTGILENMTRPVAMQLVLDRGGKCSDRMTLKTNFLVLGNNDFCPTIKDGKSNKQKQAEQMKLDGYDIEVISENVFLDMINY